MRDVILILCEISDAAGDVDDELPASSARHRPLTGQGSAIDSPRTFRLLCVGHCQPCSYSRLVQGIRHRLL